MALLTANNISISFSGIPILHDVHFEINEGEINCLCGGNGAGKSTLVKILMGINTGYTGEIIVNGQPVRMESPRDAIKYGIYGVQQHRDLAPTLDAVENMFLGNEIYVGKSRQRYDKKEMTRLAKEYIAKFGVTIDLTVPVSKLKVSEQGIIAICKALAANSKILLIDEASAPLDDSERLALYDSLSNLAKEGKGIVYITHHLDEVFRIGHTITVLRDGRNVDKFSTKEIDKDQLIASMTGNAKLYEREDKEDLSGAETVFEMEGICAKGLRDISLSVKKGEILGIAGLEGSGKDLIAKACFGMLRRTAGKIRLHGREVAPANPISAIKEGIGFVPNDRKRAGLVLCQDISDNIVQTKINKDAMHLVRPGWARKMARDYIQNLHVRCAGPGQYVEYLSGGNQQKVLIAKWLETDVDVLFMIEPTEGIDVGARSDLYKLFKELAKEGKSIIVATSDIDELMMISDRIITMVEGQILSEYDIHDADKQTILTDILSKADAAG